MVECGRSLVFPVSQTYGVSQSFESFSEDPYLSGILASAYINGLQAGGIGATIKHFWCVILFRWNKYPSDRRFVTHSANDKEDERFSYDSIVSDRALREIYMMPFMLAQKYAKPWAIMTACVPPVTRLYDGALLTLVRQLQPPQRPPCGREPENAARHRPKGVGIRRDVHERLVWDVQC